jgi:O-antigen ligase
LGSAIRQGVAPVYLFLCLVFGGSAQGISTNALLQLIGLAIIAWAAAAPADAPMTRPVRQILWLLVACLALVLLQLIPLPASLWPHLGGREVIAEGYRVLGRAIPPRPLSLAPYTGLSTLLAIVPAVATFCAVVRLNAYRPAWLILALLAGAFGGILVGTLQVSSADPRTSSWYFYPQSSFGYATGFFANTNNMAILLVICLPFIAALLVAARGAALQRYSAVAASCAAAAVVIVVGIALNSSLAGYGLSVPVLVATALMLVPVKGATRRLMAVGTGVLLIAAVAFMATSPAGERMFGTSVSVQSRAVIMSTAARATQDFMPFGSGLGSFRSVYQLYEDHDRITRVHANHAHNDYLQLALELGAPGVILIGAFLAWWAFAAWRAWRYSDSGPFARAATIASAVLLAHSFVEFPLRTAALSACFAMCIALMAVRPVQRKAEREDLRPARHLELR